MSHAHDRFDALAGALALGEASDAERAEFGAHARTCAACANDAAELPATFALVREARASERWDPHGSGELDARTRERRERSSRRTLTTLGYAVAASVVVNLAFVSGFGARALDALRVVPDTTPVVATRLTIEKRIATEQAAMFAPARATIALRPSTVRPAAVVRAPGPRVPRHAKPAAPAAQPDDPLSGLAVEGGYPAVAVAPATERCADASVSEAGQSGSCGATRPALLP
jgi:Putative zinc-finger